MRVGGGAERRAELRRRHDSRVVLLLQLLEPRQHFGDEAALDRYVDNHFQLDLSAKYKLTKNIKLFYEWVNINNAKYYAYNNFGGQRNPYQFEEYSWTMKGGVRVTF